MRNILLAVAALAASLLGLALLLNGQVWLALVLHIVAAAVGGYAAILSDSRRSGEHWFQAAIAFCLPVAGPFAAFLLSEAVKRKKTGRLSEEFAVYLNDAATFRESVPVTDSEVPSADEMVPLSDILANPVSEAEQRVAVENLSNMETPMAMAALRKVIDSGAGEGRFFAMTALGQLEERLFSKLQALEESIESGRTSDPDVFLEAARTYLDFSYFQLAQDARREEFLAKAKDMAEKAMRQGGFDPETWILVGRIELLQGNTAEAKRCFDSYLEAFPESPKGLLWRAEAWFALGEYDQVRNDCLQVLEFGGAPSLFRETVMFWAESTATEWDPEDREGHTRATRRVHTRTGARSGRLPAGTRRVG